MAASARLARWLRRPPAAAAPSFFRAGRAGGAPGARPGSPAPAEQQPRPRNKLWSRIAGGAAGRRSPTAVLALLALALGAAACAPERSHGEPEDPSVPVRVQPVERRSLARVVTLTGRLQASERVEIRPEVAGRILAFHRREGDAVEAGDRLVELDATEYRLEVERAEAALAQAEARLEDAERELARTRELFEQDILSQSALDRAEVETRIARADVKAARAARNLAARHLADTKIRAPISGVLQDRRYSVGDLVGPSVSAGSGNGGASGAGLAGSAALFTLIQIDPLHVELNVAEQDLPYVRRSEEPIPVRADVWPGREWPGHIDYIAPSLHPQAHTQLIRLRVPNGDGGLKPGMFVRAEATREVAEEALVIRADALVNLGGASGAYVVDGDTARLRRLEVAFVTGNRAAVTSGLQPGERVVFEGQSSLRDGSRVRVVEPEPAEVAAES